MVKSPPWKRRRWRGVPLGGHLQRGCRFCLAGSGYEATTSEIAEWCRPELVAAGGKPTRWQTHSHAKALRSIGAKRIRREGSQWIWRLSEASGQVLHKSINIDFPTFYLFECGFQKWRKKMATFGYARVSTRDQDLAGQIAELQ